MAAEHCDKTWRLDIMILGIRAGGSEPFTRYELPVLYRRETSWMELVLRNNSGKNRRLELFSQGPEVHLQGVGVGDVLGQLT